MILARKVSMIVMLLLFLSCSRYSFHGHIGLLLFTKVLSANELSVKFLTEVLETHETSTTRNGLGMTTPEFNGFQQT